MGDLNGAEDYWLEGGVGARTMGAENGFLQEVDRVIELLGADESWLSWWRRISKAPVLELHMIVVRSAYDGTVEERVVRGRKRHLVEMRIDFHELEALEPDERRLLALSAVLEGVSRAQQALRLSGAPRRTPQRTRRNPSSACTNPTSSGGLGFLLEKLPGRREAEPLVHRHRLAAGVNRDVTGPKRQRMVCRGLYQRRAETVAAKLRYDEHALDVRRTPCRHARPGHPWNDRQPRHADEL
jgi:hypothetical protein